MQASGAIREHCRPRLFLQCSLQWALVPWAIHVVVPLLGPGDNGTALTPGREVQLHDFLWAMGCEGD